MDVSARDSKIVISVKNTPATEGPADETSSSESDGDSGSGSNGASDRDGASDAEPSANPLPRPEPSQKRKLARAPSESLASPPSTGSKRSKGEGSSGWSGIEK